MSALRKQIPPSLPAVLLFYGNIMRKVLGKDFFRQSPKLLDILK